LQGTRTDEEFAKSVGLGGVPENPSPIATHQDIDDLRGWLIYEEAKRPNNNVVLYFAIDDTGRWHTSLYHEGQEFGPHSNDPIKGFDEYQVVRIGRVLSRLHSGLG